MVTSYRYGETATDGNAAVIRTVAVVPVDNAAVICASAVVPFGNAALIQATGAVSVGNVADVLTSAVITIADTAKVDRGRTGAHVVFAGLAVRATTAAVARVAA